MRACSMCVCVCVCEREGGGQEGIQGFGWETQRKETTWNSRGGWKDIKSNLTEIGREAVN